VHADRAVSPWTSGPGPLRPRALVDDSNTCSVGVGEYESTGHGSHSCYFSDAGREFRLGRARRRRPPRRAWRRFSCGRPLLPLSSRMGQQSSFALVSPFQVSPLTLADEEFRADPEAGRGIPMAAKAVEAAATIWGLVTLAISVIHYGRISCSDCPLAVCPHRARVRSVLVGLRHASAIRSERTP
jgi:hypothetical protein